MSTQYDQIGTLYNDMKALPAAKLERENVREAVAPYINGANVLDLACGTGYYSQALLEWGASNVVGVDISHAMIDGAKAAAATAGQSERLKFTVGDCSTPARFEGGPFDLVVACWLLNYAPDGVEMAKMFRNVALNLKPGGTFVGIVQPPTENVEEDKDVLEAGRWRKYGVSIKFTERVEEGYRTHVTGHTSPKTVEFDNFYLRKSVYEESARKGGLAGLMRWRAITFPQDQEKVLGKQEAGFWDDYLDWPHFGVLVIGR